jgi:hypothetical protein
MAQLNIKKGFLTDFTATINDKTGQPVDLSPYDSIFFVMVNQKDDSVKINSPAIFVNKVLGQVKYEFQAADVDTVGKFKAYFGLKNATSEKKLAAPSTNFEIEINDDYLL